MQGKKHLFGIVDISTIPLYNISVNTKRGE